jgi:hypothetical protein
MCRLLRPPEQRASPLPFLLRATPDDYPEQYGKSGAGELSSRSQTEHVKRERVSHAAVAGAHCCAVISFPPRPPRRAARRPTGRSIGVELERLVTANGDALHDERGDRNLLLAGVELPRQAQTTNAR